MANWRNGEMAEYPTKQNALLCEKKVSQKWNCNGIRKKVIIYKRNEKKHSVIIIGPIGETDRGTVWFFNQPLKNINTLTIVIIIIIDMMVWLFVTKLSLVKYQLVAIFLNHLSLV